ncbi:FAD-binding oxidoreductase [Undibacterium sp. LX40W]|uniref:FAD-binding oxidoreductase n=1 Tax=Undibacterium nitidum TaxID=2762298 RepID=A0A923KR43_9BURK|nr:MULTISPECIES: FAD-binding oxidoreductase [Undibacterium]MBC3879826.1 FAD-binding oxidoreductase [Undibacterium nitidum]MBC3891438.1 FAD-binding oxidoreductase [Undibacterium sp. LX40W]
MNNFLQHCRDLIGERYVLTDIDQQAVYLSEWRQRRKGKACAVLLPANTEQVAGLVKLCSERRIAITPQGGNTGLVFGSIPDSSGAAVLLSLKRLNQVRQVDIDNNTMTVEAGCLLNVIQNTADQHQRLFPLSLASEGSCTIGGNLSTNAGGTAVLRYGNTRELCLGLEVVTAEGHIWNGLRSLRKDNTGYDLRDVFIGAEGTLGIITAAVLKLFPKPTSVVTAFISLDNVENALQLLHLMQRYHADSLTAFELINSCSLELVLQHIPQVSRIFYEKTAYYVLLELSNTDTFDNSSRKLESSIEIAFNQALIRDAAIAQTLSQAANCWKTRESISEAQARQGKNIKHDVSLPISRIAEFVKVCDAALSTAYPGCQLVTFGHLGDGNLHYNVSPPIEISSEIFLEKQCEVNRVVHDLVHQFDGSISAEHGIGELKKDELQRYKSPVELAMMRQIKSALDPHNLMNPGKIF